MLKYRSVFVVYDANVAEFAARLGKYPSLGIVAEESGKRFEMVGKICSWLLEQGADRESVLVAVGGGITTDMAGFAACIYKRGIRYINVPTTLLSQIDAGIGGKTGVNLDSYKNMLGVIAQPVMTYICPKVLETLPSRELRSGAAEMIKTFIIGGAAWYEKAIDEFSAPRNVEELAPLVKEAASIKAKIVRSDPREQGKRRVLNLGHTYGHAVEWYQHAQGVEDPYTHGEAVAIGLVQAARKSEAEGYAKPGLASKIESDLKRCGLPVELPCPEEELEQAMLKDKKAVGGKIYFVFIERIGKVTVKKI